MNYTQTAKRLQLTQPAVTKHIQHLEQVLNCSLVTYEHQKVRLTPQGQQVLPYFEDLLKVNNKLMSLRPTTDSLPAIRMGVSVTLGEYLMGSILKDFYAAYPDFNLQLEIINTQKIEEKLLSQDLDLAMVLGPTKVRHFVTFPLAVMPLRFFTHPKNPLLKQSLFLKDLLGERLLVRESGSGVMDVLTLNLNRHGLSIQDFPKTQMIGNNLLIKDLVKNGQGISVLYELAIVDELTRGELAVLEVADFDLACPTTLIVPPSQMVDDRINLMIEFLSAIDFDKTGQI